MSYVKQINKILRKKSPVTGGREMEYDHLDWEEKEILEPLARLGPEAIEDMITVFKTPQQHYAICGKIYQALVKMANKSVDAKAKVIAALEGLLQETENNKLITMDSDMRRRINFELQILKK